MARVALTNDDGAFYGAVKENLDTLVRGNLSSTPHQVYIGANLATPRPTWPGPVYWLTTVVGGTPTNAQSGDQILEVTRDVITGEVIFADDFNRADGPIATTNVGGRPWTFVGGATGLEILGNQAAFTGLSGASLALADAGTADGVLRATLSAIGAGATGLAFRSTDNSNRFAITRLTTSDLRYQIARRVNSSSSTTIATFDKVMTAGDKIEVYMNGPNITVSVNGVEQWSGTDTNHQTVTKHGLYNGLESSARWDDVSFEALA